MPGTRQRTVEVPPGIFPGRGPWLTVSATLRWWLAGGIVVAVLCLGNFDLILGKSAPQWDGADYFGPEFS